MSDLWRELHEHALTYIGTNDGLFLLRWSKKIPNYEGGCKCRSFYRWWTKQNPPDYANYFEWTVKLHNAVNQKLNKPILSVEDAKLIYQKDS